MVSLTKIRFGLVCCAFTLTTLAHAEPENIPEVRLRPLNLTRATLQPIKPIGVRLRTFQLTDPKLRPFRVGSTSILREPQADQCPSLLRNKIELLKAKARVQFYRGISFLENKIRNQPYYEASGFHSQNGQDEWLFDKVFVGKRTGVFVDVGAHNGVEFSNTYFFEQSLNWTGLCVEPVPASFQVLDANRQCLCVQGCVSTIEGPVSFLHVDVDHNDADGAMLSGIAAHYDPAHLDRANREVQKFGGQVQTIETESYRLQTLLDLSEIKHIDYLSIDTEGAELEVLKSIDFDRTHISVISVEDNYGELEVPMLLKQKGFRRVKRIGRDDFYFNFDFRP